MKANKFLLQLTAVVASSTLLLAGCSGGAGSSSSGSNKGEPTVVAAGDYNKLDRDAIEDGGTLTTAIAEIAEQQNRFHADSTANTTQVWTWYNPQLALYDEEGNYTPNPDYLSDVKSEEVDGKTKVTYTIVDEAKWNDGTDIDWTAFETTWIINNGKDEAFVPSATDGYEKITSVTQGETPKQAVVEFDGPYPFWPGLFNDIAHPALKDPANYNDYLKKVHPEWGAGPFKVETVDFNKGEAIFVRNENWWGDTPKLDKRIYRQMEDNASVNAFKNGEIDATGASLKERYAAVKDLPGVELRTAIRPSKILITYNSKSEVLNDVKVREALSTGLNRDVIAEITFNGIPYSEKLPGSLVVYQTQPGYEDNYSKAATFDADKAKSMLDEAGWKEGDGGIREKDGKKLTVRYVIVGDSDTIKAQSTAIQKMWKDIGVDLQIDQRPSSEFSDIIKSKDFDIMPSAFSDTDPFGVAYFGQTYLSDSTLNNSGTGTPELDEKIREMQKLPTAEEQTKRANELEVEAFKTFGLTPLYNGPSIIATKEKLANYGATGFAIIPVEDIGWEK